ncbi:hypothetical protein ABMA10_17735 [Plantibacter sp. RU18]
MEPNGLEQFVRKVVACGQVRLARAEVSSVRRDSFGDPGA